MIKYLTKPIRIRDIDELTPTEKTGEIIFVCFLIPLIGAAADEIGASEVRRPVGDCCDDGEANRSLVGDDVSIKKSDDAERPTN